MPVTFALPPPVPHPPALRDFGEFRQVGYQRERSVSALRTAQHGA